MISRKSNTTLREGVDRRFRSAIITATVSASTLFVPLTRVLFSAASLPCKRLNPLRLNLTLWLCTPLGSRAQKVFRTFTSQGMGGQSGLSVFG